MGRKRESRTYDVVVVGGGMSGVCAAVASARGGAKTCLVQNRPVLGGNASSEIRMHICGALGLGHDRKNARETGILEEILLENLARNPQHSFSVFDTILWEKTAFQEGLELYLNTHMTGADVRDGTILSIRAEQLTTETSFAFQGALFVDATGDASLAALAGAECMKGREGKERFGESLAPDAPDGCTMGNTLLFESVDLGRPVPFEKPAWAYTYTKEDLAEREIDDLSSGYWWIELGGGELDTIADAERIRDELLRSVYGVWDYIKNRGGYGAENLALRWVGFLPGKRDSRRVVGDYVLTERDLREPRGFEDAVAYGGWPIDLHVVEGIRNRQAPTAFIHLGGVYAIPYRCLYARDIRNLFVGGRAWSASHVAFSSARVMATCAVAGQAIGTAAAAGIRTGLLPGELGGRIGEIQQRLLRDDAYIPGLRNADPLDLAKESTVTASSSLPGSPASNVLNGIARAEGGQTNCWISEPLGIGAETISLSLPRPAAVRELDLRFDSDLSRENMLSLSHRVLHRFNKGLAHELVRDYEVRLVSGGRIVHEERVRGNHLRHRVHALPGGSHTRGPLVDEVRITVLATHGDPHARIFEIRLYEERR
jgi:hypothetical protein